MSSELQHKMYHYEVTPPSGAWDKIAGALDESYLADRFPAVLHDAAIAPPAGAWDTIAASLGELEDANQFPVTLYNLETAPPASAWKKIAASLDEEDQPVISIGRRIPPFIRYAVAAMLIGAVAFAAFSIFNHKKDTSGVANGNPAPVQDKTAPVNIEKKLPPTEIAEQTQEAMDDAALEKSKHTYASLDLSNKHRTTMIGDDFFSAPAATITAAQDIAPEHTYRDLECSDVHNALYTSVNPSIDMASRYAMLMTPDGHIIRISKKLGSLVCCVSGEEQDQDCKDQLKKWRQRIADAPVAPSPGNFMDILSLLHTLDNNL